MNPVNPVYCFFLAVLAVRLPAPAAFGSVDRKASTLDAALGMIAEAKRQGQAVSVGLLGNAGECFECGHDHGGGDRCLAFAYSQDMLESPV